MVVVQRRCARSRRRLASRLVWRVGVGPPGCGVGGTGSAPRSRRSAWWAWRSSSSVIWCRSWRRGAVRLVSVSAGRRVHSPEVGDVVQLLGDGGDRGRDRVLLRCRRMPLSYREFWHRPPTSRAENRLGSGMWTASRKSWSPHCRGLDKLDHRRVGATPTTDQSRAYVPLSAPYVAVRSVGAWHHLNHSPARTRGATSTTRRTSPRSCAVSTTHHPATAAPWSRRARWRSLLDHRRAGRGASTPPCPTRSRPPPRAVPLPELRLPPPTAAQSSRRARWPSLLDPRAGEQRLLSHRHTHPDAVSSPRRLRPGAPATASEGGLTSETCQRTSTNASQPSSRRFWRTPRSCRRCRGSTSRR